MRRGARTAGLVVVLVGAAAAAVACRTPTEIEVVITTDDCAAVSAHGVSIATASPNVRRSSSDMPATRRFKSRVCGDKG